MRWFVSAFILLASALPAGGCRQSATTAISSSAEKNVPENLNLAVLEEAERLGTWFHAKKTRPIRAKKLSEAQVVQTLEGEEEVLAGSYLCRGEAGDIWPQKEAELLKRYQPSGEADAEGWQTFAPRDDAQGVMAIQFDHPFAVQTSWGKLSGKAGDYLVKNFADRNAKSPADVWIVDQSLFAATYERVAKE
jgi:hypothetical protein